LLILLVTLSLLFVPSTQYSLTSMAIKIMNNIEPHDLVSILHETFYSTRRRPRIDNFCDNSNGKIGRQKLKCKLKSMDGIKFDWLEVDLNVNRLRILLKDTFFSNLATTWQSVTTLDLPHWQQKFGYLLYIYIYFDSLFIDCQCGLLGSYKVNNFIY